MRAFDAEQYLLELGCRIDRMPTEVQLDHPLFDVAGVLVAVGAIDAHGARRVVEGHQAA